MIKRLFIAILAMTILAGHLVAQNSNWYMGNIWENEDRNYQWYPDKQKQKRQEQQPQPQNELAQFDLMQKRLTELRKVAIMNPTEENLKNYIQIQEMAMNQAATFTDQWQRVIWQNPSLDYSQKGRPTTQVAIQQYDANRLMQKERAIQQLAGQNGILFVFRSDCPYCHSQAPIVREFASKYGISVMPVSLDGRGIDMYPQPLPNNGIAEKLGVKAVPAIYVMDTKTKQFKAISFGIVAMATLEDRFLAYSQPVGTLY